MFKSEQAWMINPSKVKRRKRVIKRGRKRPITRSMLAALAEGRKTMARRRKHRKSYSRKRRGSRKRHSYAMNPNVPNRRRRRVSKSYARSHRRRYRRNPDGITTGFLWDAAYVTGGFIATRVTSNMVLPMFPMLTTMPIMRIVSKGVVAWGLGYLGGMALGRRSGNLIMVGGFVDVLDDAVKTYVAPFVPALGQNNDMGLYPSLQMGVYPQLGANGYDAPWNVGANEYSAEDSV